MNTKADEARQKQLLTNQMKLWVSRRPDWHQIYKKRYTYPMLYWGIKILGKSMKQWKEFTANQKVERDVINEQKAAREKHLLRQMLAIVDEKDEKRACSIAKDYDWAASPRNAQLALKYASKWRIKVLKSRQTSSEADKDPVFEIGELFKPRPKPRKPNFWYDKETNKFIPFVNINFTGIENASFAVTEFQTGGDDLESSIFSTNLTLPRNDQPKNRYNLNESKPTLLPLKEEGVLLRPENQSNKENTIPSPSESFLQNEVMPCNQPKLETESETLKNLELPLTHKPVAQEIKVKGHILLSELVKKAPIIAEQQRIALEIRKEIASYLDSRGSWPEFDLLKAYDEMHKIEQGVNEYLKKIEHIRLVIAREEVSDQCEFINNHVLRA
jgi:hypothetical protein